MPAPRVCSEPGCPVLTMGGRCPEHRREVDKARGTRQQRGYDARHDALRSWWAPKVAAGGVTCRAATCLRPSRLIGRDEPWDLGHTPDRSDWTGPEHAACNRSAGGRSAHD